MPKSSGPDSDSPESLTTMRSKTGALRFAPVRLAVIDFVIASCQSPGPAGILVPIVAFGTSLFSDLRPRRHAPGRRNRTALREMTLTGTGCARKTGEESLGRNGRIGSLRSRDRRRKAIRFADLEAGEAANPYILAELRDRLVDQFLHRHALVLDEVLLVKAIFLVKLFHPAVHDLFDHTFGLPACFRLLAVDVALAVKDSLGDFLAAEKTGIESGD